MTSMLKRKKKARRELLIPKPSGPKTKMIAWRGGDIEFARKEGCGFNSTDIAKPPWYVVRYRGKYWGRKWNYDWLDYGGPPQVFLTRKQAEIRAKAFRKQYAWGEQFKGGPLKVEVMRINP